MFYEQVTASSNYWVKSSNQNIFNNFLINTITDNPISSNTVSNKNTQYSLIFGGQKDNKSYILNTSISLCVVNRTNTPILPTLTQKPIINEKTGSFVSKMILTSVAKSNINKNDMLIPLLIFGSKMNTSNSNLSVSETGYVQTTNKQTNYK